jgi:hypothetical protein
MLKIEKISTICKISILSIIFSIICLLVIFYVVPIINIFTLNPYFSFIIRVLLIILFVLTLIIAIITGAYSLVVKKELFGLIGLILGTPILIVTLFILFITAIFLGIIPIEEDIPNVEATIIDVNYVPTSDNESYTWYVTLNIKNNEEKSIVGFGYCWFETNKNKEYMCLPLYDIEIPANFSENITFSTQEIKSIPKDEKPVTFNFQYDFLHEHFPSTFIELEIPENLIKE